MSKATANGVYTLDGNRYVLAKGDPVPDGAEVEYTAETEPETKAVLAAPENKAEQAPVIKADKRG